MSVIDRVMAHFNGDADEARRQQRFDEGRMLLGELGSKLALLDERAALKRRRNGGAEAVDALVVMQRIRRLRALRFRLAGAMESGQVEVVASIVDDVHADAV